MAPAHETAVAGLIRRLLPDAADRFVLETISADGGRDVFEIETVGTETVLRGSSGSAIAGAFHWFLKYHCGCHVSWFGDQLALPNPLPRVPDKVRIPSPFRYRYCFNYCAFGYSMPWWDWARWEREIDFMALNGVNMPLAITGQEAVWQNVCRRLGVPDDETREFLAGPVFLPWQWMGNLHGTGCDAGGPLPQTWIDSHCDLQRKILERERSFGMTPILQGFFGHVPATFKQIFPNADIAQLRSWCGMAPTWFLDPVDPAFAEVGSVFYEEQEKLYGTDHLYAMDLFHEGAPRNGDEEYLARAGEAAHGTMAAADPQAVWVMMSWSMRSAIVKAVPREHLVMLDLGGGMWRGTEAFHGHPWVWCVIHNFGGMSGMFGELRALGRQLPATLHDPGKGDLAGIGCAAEAIENNPIYYELLFEMAWRTHPPKDRWVKEYAARRYGRQLEAAEDAWQILEETVYSGSGATGPAESVICARPALRIEKACNGTVFPWFRIARLAEAWKGLLDCADDIGGRATYQYDLVDVGREVLSNRSRFLHDAIVAAYRAKDRPALRTAWDRMRSLILDLDELLGTSELFLLGRWIADARRWATNDREAALYDYNARVQVTRWLPDVSFHDYANKQWSGLLRSFYLARWQKFIDRLDEAVAQCKPFDEAAFESEIADWELAWARKPEPMPAEPAGDAIAISRRLFARYGST